ncbi:MAG TPA: isoprenylcysteine carboxylmethyltransferase family protein [Panacibacter sp.]|nr:isoprenylcysteine carboxylmethyltransferase family protein [Panacibacter sp.]HNP45209.1 isoprenylcysteine carboxylmethyltransferase family protein [Panacibacter sp.]
MDTIFVVVYVAWFLSELLLDRVMRTHKPQGHSSTVKPLLVIWIVGILSVGFAVFFAYNFYFPISANEMVAYWGLFIIVIGIIVRLMVVKSMGRLFSSDMNKRHDHELITDGFFKYLRHPAFSASFLSFVGFGISLNNYISFMVIFFSVIYVFTRRIEAEEEQLVKQFGEEYEAYRKKTKGLIPFIY